MGLPGVSVRGGNLKGPEEAKVNQLVDEYIDTFQQLVRQANLAPGFFSFGRPTNYYLALDKQHLHLVYSSDHAGGLSEVMAIDLREQGAFPLEEVARFFQSQRGFMNWEGISFPATWLDNLDSEDVRAELLKAAENKLRKERERLLRKHQPLFISEEQLRKFLGVVTEDEFTQVLLVPMFRHLGFRAATAKGHTDRTLEFGQDIRNMKFQLPTGHWLYFAAQVKAGNIGYSGGMPSQHIETILTQVQSAFEWEMFDAELNTQVKPDHVLLIVSGTINEGARQYLYRRLSESKRRRVLFWDADSIVAACQQYGLPEHIQRLILKKTVSSRTT